MKAKQSSLLIGVACTLYLLLIRSFSQGITVGPLAQEATFPTPEIAELARAFGSDHLAAYNWVRSNVESQYYANCAKGAHATLMEGAGGDTDKACLLFSILKQMDILNAGTVGYLSAAPEFAMVDAALPPAFFPPLPAGWKYDAPSWPGFNVTAADFPALGAMAPENRDHYAWCITWAAYCGFSPIVNPPANPAPNSCHVRRYLVSCIVGGTRRYLDPFVQDWISVSGAAASSLTSGSRLEQPALIGKLGTLVGNNTVANYTTWSPYANFCQRTTNAAYPDSNDSALRAELDAISAAVLDDGNPTTSDLDPKTPVEEVLPSLWVPRPVAVATMGMDQGLVIGTPVALGDLPESIIPRAELSFTAGSSAKISLPLMQLRGRRLACKVKVASSNTVGVRLLLDDLEQTWAGGSGTEITVPNSSRFVVSTGIGRTRSYSLYSGSSAGATYLWVLHCGRGFNATQRMVAERLARLSRLRLSLADPLAAIPVPVPAGADQNLKEDILLETLHIQGLQYLMQTRFGDQILSLFANCRSLYDAVNMRVFQGVGGNTIDAAIDPHSFPHDGTRVCERRFLHLSAIFGSALEHAVIEQSGGFKRTGPKLATGISTARMIREAFNQRSPIWISRADGNAAANLPQSSGYSTPPHPVPASGYGNPATPGTDSYEMTAWLLGRVRVNGASRSGNIVTVMCDSAHELCTGDQISLSGMVTTGTTNLSPLNGGPFTVTADAIDPSKCTFTLSGANESASGGSLVASWAPASIATGGISWSGTLVTVTTQAAHCLRPGHLAVLSGTTGGFDGNVEVIAVPTPTTFIFARSAGNGVGGLGTVQRQRERTTLYPGNNSYSLNLPGGSVSSGVAYAVFGVDESTQWLGGMGGGRSFLNFLPSSPMVNDVVHFLSTTPPFLMITAASAVADLATSQRESAGTHHYSSDPVNLATGAFEYAHVDLEIGTGEAPRGLGLMRTYNSRDTDRDEAGLGRGWTHSWQFEASIRSDAGAAFGREDIRTAIPMLIAMRALVNCHRGYLKDMKAEDYTLLNLIACWAVDKITGNAVTFQMGSEGVSFVKGPGGKWIGLGNSMELEEGLENGKPKWIVRARNGHTYRFARNDATPNSIDSVSIEDQDLALLEASYLPNGRVNAVVDGCRGSDGSYTNAGRLDFHYDGPRLDFVTVSRIGWNVSAQVYYQITNSNLVSFTDAAGAVWGYEYAPGSSLMTRQLNADSQVACVNVYDGLDRVKEQLSMGDSQRLWKFLYLGNVTREIDPVGRSLGHYYDHRGREHAVEFHPSSNSAPKQVERRAFDAMGNVVASAIYPDLATAKLDTAGSRLVDGAYVKPMMERLPATGALESSLTVYDNYRGLIQRSSVTAGVVRQKVENDYEYFLPATGHPNRNIGRLVQTRSTKDNPEQFTKVTSFTYFVGNPIDATAPTVKLKDVIDGLPSSTVKTSFTYHSAQRRCVNGLIDSITDRVGRVTRYYPDILGTPDWVNGSGGRVEYTYDWQGNLIQTQTGSDLTDNLIYVDCKYDGARRATHVTTTAGGLRTTQRTVYDLSGRPVESWYVNHPSAAGPINYNEVETLPKRSYTRKVYNALDQVVAEISGHANSIPVLSPNGGDPLGATARANFPYTLIDYDLNDRPWHTTDLFGLTSTEKYYPSGASQETEEVYLPGVLPRKSTIPLYDDYGVALQLQDVLNRTTSVNPQRNVSLFAGGPGGDIVAATIGGITTANGVDFAGRTRTITNGNGNVFRMDYNENDLLLQITTPHGFRKRSSYDAEGRLTGVFESPPQGAETPTASYSYFPAVMPSAGVGQAPETELRSGLVEQVSFSLPASGQPAATVKFSKYTADGRPREVTESIAGVDQTIFRTFSGHRVAAYTGQAVPGDPVDAAAYGIGYEYYADGALKTLIYPDMNPASPTPAAARSVGYEYYQSGKLWRVTENFTTPAVVTEFTWNRDGSLDAVRRGNGTIRKHIYDGGGRLKAIDERFALGGGLITTSRTDLDQGDRVVYQLHYPVLSQNITPVSFSGASYDEDNRIISLAGVSFGYSADGNLGGNMSAGFAVKPTERQKYAFDTRSRLVEILPVDAAGQEVPGRNSFAYTYDSEGIRNSRTEFGPKPGSGGRPVAGFTRYIYEASSDDTPQLLVRRTGTTGAAASWVRYVYGVGLLHEYSSAGVRRYYHCDDAANVVAITDHPAPGQLPRVSDRMDYTPYGQLCHRSSPTPGLSATDTPFLFAGMTGVVSDPDGLIYMNARYYSPVLCRFLSGDPAGFDGGSNWHAYAQGNPLHYVDPSGYGPSAVRDLLQLGITVIGMAFGPAGMAVAAGVNAFISAAAGDSVGAAMFLGEAALGAAAGIARWARPAGSLIPVITNTGRTYSPLRTLPLPVRPPPVVPTVTNPGGGGCFAAGTPVATPGGSAPIEEVKVGSRVAGPVSGGDEKVETAVDPPNWRLVSLEMRSLDGTSTMHIQTLRSVQWLAENGYKVGGETWVHLEELGLQGACDIVGIQPCPLLAEGPGQIVLSTMQSRSTFLLEIRFQGVDPPLRVTAQHLLKDARSGEWIAAGLVKEGAVLTSRSGDRAVSSITPFPVPVEVFNLEVEHDHCYFAGSAQLLAHNAGCGTTWTSNSGPTVDLGTRSVGTAAKSAPAQFPQGSFSITDLGWQGYPAGVPKPAGPFRLLEGAEYDAARKAANQANNQIRVDQGLRGQPVDVHETQPVKFGGSATDPANKVILDRATHRQQVTPWWNNLMRRITGG